MTTTGNLTWRTCSHAPMSPVYRIQPPKKAAGPQQEPSLRERVRQIGRQVVESPNARGALRFIHSPSTFTGAITIRMDGVYTPLVLFTPASRFLFCFSPSVSRKPYCQHCRVLSFSLSSAPEVLCLYQYHLCSSCISISDPLRPISNHWNPQLAIRPTSKVYSSISGSPSRALLSCSLSR